MLVGFARSPDELALQGPECPNVVLVKCKISDTVSRWTLRTLHPCSLSRAFPHKPRISQMKLLFEGANMHISCPFRDTAVHCCGLPNLNILF
jgi:hypothetical protein